jgi:hypothetical protein
MDSLHRCPACGREFKDILQPLGAIAQLRYEGLLTS